MIPIEFLSSVDSTSLEASRRAAAGDLGPVWIAAETQTAGRGRLDRDWISPLGNLHATLLMPFDRAVNQASLHSYIAALAVLQMLDPLINDASRLKLKWPNDVLVDGRKICGILLESGGFDGRRWLSIGIGINLRHAPPGTRLPSISLSDIARSAPEPREALPLLRETYAANAALFERDGFPVIREAWLSRAAHLGKDIEARMARETIRGRFDGIDEAGMLMLMTQSGPMKIAAADVFLPEGE